MYSARHSSSPEGTFFINDKMICKFQFSELIIMNYQMSLKKEKIYMIIYPKKSLCKPVFKVLLHPFKHQTSPEGTIVPGELNIPSNHKTI